MVVEVLKQMRDRLDYDSRQNHQSDFGQISEQNEIVKTGKTAKSEVYAYRQPIPDDLWIRCPACNGVMFRDDFEQADSVCSICGHHYRLDSLARLAQICDQGSFEEFDADMTSLNPIGFDGYSDKLEGLKKKTGLKDAVITGRAAIDGQDCLIAIMDGRFMMGSMGSVVGEKITRVFERGIDLRLPVICFTVSGGARMQEGIVSLMQMAKTSAAVGRFNQAGLLYISVLTDPTTGGVTASFASLGDIIISEPGTLIGFAGRRVIEGTIAEDLPEGFQRAEFLLEHGFLDLIVPRHQMKETLAKLLRLHATEDIHHENLDKKKVDSSSFKSLPNKLRASERLDLIRHRNRPVITDYLSLVFDEVIELHGDRFFMDDQAMWSGIGSIHGQPVTIVGHRKGHTIEENTKTNFGMPHPEGYRKALRLMKQAEKFQRPVICLVDTSGAYCGVGAEERGQGEAIARNLMEIMQLNTPVLVVVTGEGGSGGALAIGIGDELAMLSNALYSVISPRGFASLLWKDPSREREAADVLKITAEDLMSLGICDAMIPEPADGAHSDHSVMAQSLKTWLTGAISRQKKIDNNKRLDLRYKKFRSIGLFDEGNNI
jgi:acetyl-CoA carboxylase carboxyl transferase subunit beta